MINLPRPGDDYQQKPIIHADWFSFALVFVFSISGGINIPLLFMRAQDNLVN